MAVISACPDVQTLEQLALGRMSSVEVERLAKHCEQCERCVQLLHTMKAEDTLAEAMAAQGTAPERPREPTVDALIEHLKRMPPPSALEVEKTAAFAAAATPSMEVTRGADISLAPPQAGDEIGRLGGYRVLKVLGAGGMGMVYHAEDVQLQRAVALKVMKPEVAQNPTARERFLREARAAAKLKSDHVVTIHQVGEDRQVVFLAMEFLEGLSLDDWLKKGRTPTLTQAARIGRQIALGLADAHGCGLIHRDIKPGNIWLDSRHQGRVKLLDFGLARGNAEEIHLTQSGAIVGTPAYMAPEQARGEHVDHRVDLFSLGVVLYRLTTGRLPFRGDSTMSILTSLAMDTPTPPRQVNPNISPRMAALIERLLAKDRAQRPATAKATADELATIEREAAQPAGEAPTVVGAASVSAPVVPAARSRLRLRRYIIAASLLLVLGGAAAAVIVIIRDPKGNKIAEVVAPRGSSIEIKDEAKPQVHIEPEPLVPLAKGEPLTVRALVQQPAKLAGVRSWSIALRESAAPSSQAYSPDGKRLAVGTWDGQVRIWEAKTGRLLRMFYSRGTVTGLAWSPDGRVLALGTGILPRPVHLWDADTGRLLRQLETPVAEFIFVLAWSPDGRKVRAWGDARRCCTWDAATGHRRSDPSVPGQRDRAEFSPDTQRLASVVDGKHLVVWNADTGQEVSRMTAPAVVGRFSWSPDGQRLACTGKDGLRIWDVEKRQEIKHWAKAVHLDNAPAWSPDGRRLVFTTLEPLGEEVIDLDGHAEPLRLQDGGGSFMAWSPDGKTIARINGEPWIILYNAVTGKRSLVLTDGRAIFGFVASHDLRTLAIAERSNAVLVSGDTGRVVAELPQASWPMVWSPDGKRLASQGPDSAVQLWEASGKLQAALEDHKGVIASLAFSPDGKRLASTAAGENVVLIWDAIKGQRERALGPFGGTVENVKWSADGRLVTFNMPAIGWHVWDVEKNSLVNDPKQWKVYWFDLSPDGRSVLVAPTEKDAYRLRDLASGKEGVGQPSPHSIYLAHPTWSADGGRLAFSNGFGIEWWRADLRKRLRAFQLDGGASHVAISRDGKRIAGMSGERLLIWDTDTGRLCGLLVLGRRNNALAISPEGHYTGNDQVQRGIVMVVEKEDGTQELLEPADFEQKYGFKNDPARVRLTGE